MHAHVSLSLVCLCVCLSLVHTHTCSLCVCLSLCYIRVHACIRKVAQHAQGDEEEKNLHVSLISCDDDFLPYLPDSCARAHSTVRRLSLPVFLSLALSLCLSLSVSLSLSLSLCCLSVCLLFTHTCMHTRMYICYIRIYTCIPCLSFRLCVSRARALSLSLSLSVLIPLPLLHAHTCMHAYTHKGMRRKRICTSV